MAEKHQKRYAIIVAGGSGSRMSTTLPKQFMMLGGMPVLCYSLDKFYEAGAEIILVLPEQHFSLWNELKAQYSIAIPHKITSGGATRSESVYNGLKCVGNADSFTGVHDAVRAMISTKLINKLYSTAFEKGNAVPVIHMNDSIRKMEGGFNSAVNRSDLRIVQTPQVFKTNELLKAFQTSSSKNFTDEASLMESCGYLINLVDGEQENFKITYPHDILVAESLLKK
jgi:2-C-methyl-D-erythritol 4-phosphate cytidylyltransferase